MVTQPAMTRQWPHRIKIEGLLILSNANLLPQSQTLKADSKRIFLKLWLKGYNQNEQGLACLPLLVDAITTPSWKQNVFFSMDVHSQFTVYSDQTKFNASNMFYIYTHELHLYFSQSATFHSQFRIITMLYVIMTCHSSWKHNMEIASKKNIVHCEQ